MQQKKVGAFNALFAAGSFLPALGDSEAGAVLSEFVSGKRQVPVDTYFIDSRSAAFLQAAPEGKQLCERMHFLGGLGVRQLHGLRVAFLSGRGAEMTVALLKRQAAEKAQSRGFAKGGRWVFPGLVLAGRLAGRRVTWKRFRMPRAGRADGAGTDAGGLPDILKEETQLETPFGRVEVVVLRPQTAGPIPTVAVNVGCYYTLADTLERAEGPRYVSQGYAYLLWRATGALEEVADQVFLRWRGDAAVVLDWLGQQRWCDGRVGCHGYSLLGNTAYATLAASHAPDAPPSRPLVTALVPAISFSRIQPTVFVRGQGLAAELALRFLWLAEVGLRKERATGLGYLWKMFGFFGLGEWPGLAEALAQRPVAEADRRLWGRANELWRGGQMARKASDAFWRESRDRQFHFDHFREAAPRIHVIAGWNDMFLAQSLEDFMEAQRATGSARLTIFTGGHFGVVMSHAGKVAAETGRWYQEHLALEGEARPAAVRMQLITDEEPEEWLECGAWPPPEGARWDLFLAPGHVGLRSEPAAGAAGATGADTSTEPLSYSYDPRDPTPYAGDGWLNLQRDGPQDQREVERRQDVLVLSSAPLEEQLEVVGEVTVSLFLSCSAPECDVLARLCVVRDAVKDNNPLAALGIGGAKSVNLCENIARVKFQEEVTRLDLSLGFTACRFRPGDQVRLHICSAAHPRWLRHPLQPPGEDWLLGDSEVGAPAKITILSERPSRLRLSLRSSEVVAA
ncbi:unnamed protein product [Effrenium voratum]|nr:unnamed protein product [Effrenium voratum]